MNHLVERLLALLPWYDPEEVAERHRRSAEARRQAIVTRRQTLAEVRHLEAIARRRQ